MPGAKLPGPHQQSRKELHRLCWGSKALQASRELQGPEEAQEVMGRFLHQPMERPRLVLRPHRHRRKHPHRIPAKDKCSTRTFVEISTNHNLTSKEAETPESPKSKRAPVAVKPGLQGVLLGLLLGVDGIHNILR